jgi:hypothetical protein
MSWFTKNQGIFFIISTKISTYFCLKTWFSLCRRHVSIIVQSIQDPFNWIILIIVINDDTLSYFQYKKWTTILLATMAKSSWLQLNLYIIITWSLYMHYIIFRERLPINIISFHILKLFYISYNYIF